MNREHVVKLRDELESLSNNCKTDHDEYEQGKSIGYLKVMNKLDAILEICEECDGLGIISTRPANSLEEWREVPCPACSGTGKQKGE